MVFFLLLAVFLLPAAYYVSYLVYGRKLTYPNKAAGDIIVIDPGGGAMAFGEQRLKWHLFVLECYRPLHEWEKKRLRLRFARKISGTWQREDGRRMTFQLDPEMAGKVSSGDFPEANFQGEWSVKWEMGAWRVVLKTPEAWDLAHEESSLAMDYERQELEILFLLFDPFAPVGKKTSMKYLGAFRKVSD